MSYDPNSGKKAVLLFAGIALFLVLLALTFGGSGNSCSAIIERIGGC